MRLMLISLALCLLSIVSGAAAQPRNAVILGLRSMEGDDDVARGLSVLLRQRAEVGTDWVVAEQAISLTQMVLAHGCDDVDVQCLASIAQGLNVELVVYGTLQHSSVQDDYNFSLKVDMFDGSKGEIVQTATVTFAQAQSAPEGLAKVAETLIARLEPQTLPSSLTIEAQVDGAEVLVDGQPRGLIENGRLSLDDVAPGLHQIRVQAVGYEEFSAVIDVEATGESQVRANLVATARLEPVLEQPAETLSGDVAASSIVPDYLPYGLLGLGVAGLGGMAASWFVIAGVGDDDTYVMYSDMVSRQLPGQDDVCHVAQVDQHSFGGAVSPSERARVSDLCDRADTFEALQFVFGGVGAAALIGGVILLILDGPDDGSAASQRPAFALQPAVGPSQAGLQATLRF